MDYYIGPIRKRPVFRTRGEAEEFKRDLLLRPLDIATGFLDVKKIGIRRAADHYLNHSAISGVALKKGIGAMEIYSE